MALIHGNRRDNVNFASLLSVPGVATLCVAVPKPIAVKVVMVNAV
jgi:hypothetical protein